MRFNHNDFFPRMVHLAMSEKFVRFNWIFVDKGSIVWTRSIRSFELVRLDSLDWLVLLFLNCCLDNLVTIS